MNKNFRSILALVLCLVMVLSVLAGCGGKKDEGNKPTPTPPAPVNPTPDKPAEEEDEIISNIIPDFVPDYAYKTATYNTTTTVMPSNWNELTYADNNDTQIMSYIGSSFFDYDFKFVDGKKFNDDGSINLAGIVDGAYVSTYSAATKLEDVTSTVDAKWGYTDDQKKEGGYAWKITLRDDLKWDDGTPITAADFVYSMKAQLDPAFMNMRGNTYYDTLRIKNSRGYFFQNQAGTYESVASQGFDSNEAAIAAGVTLYVDIHNLWGAAGYKSADGAVAPQWVTIDDTTVYSSADGSDAISGKALWDGYNSILGVGGDYEDCVAIYVENKIRDVKWEDVGIYAEGNAIVVCLDKAYALLKSNGGLSYQAAYYMASLPLVHKAKYEANMHAPEEGATLWTSTYNTTLESTASWGPYKLAEFVAGSYYKLVKNENWFGWNMNNYANQYNVDAIYCVKVADWNTNWMGFLAGNYDDASLQTENIADYKDSKYVTYQPSTGTFGMQLYSNLPVLKASENNNGILAIQEFRHAFNLSLNRSDIVETIWPGTSTPCFGLVNSEYYYDIENSPKLEDSGVYRFSTQAKEGILRAYGFTQAADGTWSNGTDLTGLELDDAYDVLTGYNPTLAKEKLQAAIEILLADPEYYGYDATKDITFIYGSSSDTLKQRQRADYLQNVLNTLTAGTALEGKIKVVFDASAGAQWAEAFRSGATQIGFGYGFSGNPFNPFDIMGAFVDPDDNLNYHKYWDTSRVDMTLTLPAGDYEAAGQTITMSVQNWFYCLNGLATEKGQVNKYNWDAGYAPADVRLTILSALEEIALKESRSIMLIGDYGGTFLSAKFSYATDKYNTFMGFGGMRYMLVNYTDAEWTQFLAENNNDLTLEYQKTE